MVASRVLIGLGGNIGEPRRSMGAALRALDAAEGTRVLAVSRLFRTPPWGRTDQPPFLNACAALETGLDPGAVLDLCLGIEHDLKRRRAERWGPRTIDLDVLDQDGRRIADPRLTLPHPRMAERAFVLVPLADIAPALIVEGACVAARAARIDRGGIVPLSVDGAWWREDA